MKIFFTFFPILFLAAALLAQKPAPSGYEDFETYPNPFSELMTIELPEGEQLRKFDLYDISGRKMRYDHNLDRNRIILHRGDLVPGIYLYRIHTGKSYSGRIVVE